MVSKISIELELEKLGTKTDPQDQSKMRIRENKNAGVNFYTARSNQYFSSVAVWMGKGRERSERKINLTIPQGKFLFHLPFPTAYFESIDTIMRKADVDNSAITEILDIVYALIELNVIEKE